MARRGTGFVLCSRVELDAGHTWEHRCDCSGSGVAGRCSGKPTSAHRAPCGGGGTGNRFWLCAGALALILAVAASYVVARQLSTTDEPESADDEAYKAPPVAETDLDAGTWFDDEGADDSFNPDVMNPLFEASSDEDDGGYFVTHEIGNPPFDSWTDSEDGASDAGSYMEVTADAPPIDVGRLKFGKFDRAPRLDLGLGP